jgi:hypothetical protein
VQKVPAGDLIARWAYSSLHSRATANLARVFLEELRKVPPFQCGPGGTGGSEFYGEFEKACKEYGIKLFVLPPRSPISVEWWNGSTGPSGRVLRYSEDEVDLATMRFHLKRWTEEVYNRKRPHWSLGRGALGGAERHRTC